MSHPDRPASRSYPAPPTHRGRDSQTPRRNRTRGTSGRGSLATPAPATVWTCGPTPTDPEAVWPTAIVETAIASFSEPEAHVALLPWPTTTDHDAGPIAPEGLIAQTPRTEPDDELAAALAAIDDLRREGRVRRLPHGEAAAVSAGVDSYGDTDLIITSVPPRLHTDHTAEELALFAARLLRGGGILVALTHHDTAGGELVDPTGRMVAAAQRADLLYLHHIVALHTPIRDGHLQDEPEDATPADGHRSQVRALPAPHRRIHSDVLVFAQPHEHQPQPTTVFDTGATQ